MSNYHQSQLNQEMVFLLLQMNFWLILFNTDWFGLGSDCFSVKHFHTHEARKMNFMHFIPWLLLRWFLQRFCLLHSTPFQKSVNFPLLIVICVQGLLPGGERELFRDCVSDGFSGLVLGCVVWQMSRLISIYLNNSQSLMGSMKCRVKSICDPMMVQRLVSNPCIDVNQRKFVQWQSEMSQICVILDCFSDWCCFSRWVVCATRIDDWAIVSWRQSVSGNAFSQSRMVDSDGESKELAGLGLGHRCIHRLGLISGHLNSNTLLFDADHRIQIADLCWTNMDVLARPKVVRLGVGGLFRQRMVTEDRCLCVCIDSVWNCVRSRWRNDSSNGCSMFCFQ